MTSVEAEKAGPKPNEDLGPRWGRRLDATSFLIGLLIGTMFSVAVLGFVFSID